MPSIAANFSKWFERTFFYSLLTIIVVFSCCYPYWLRSVSLISQTASDLFSETLVNQLHRTSVLQVSMNALRYPHYLDLDSKKDQISPILLLPTYSKASFASDRGLSLSWKLVTVKSGDSMTTIFKRAQINWEDYRQLLMLPSAKTVFKQLRPGQTIKLILDKDHHIQQLRYTINASNDSRYFKISRVNDRLVESFIKRDIVKKSGKAHGVIHSSLSESVKRAGLPYYCFNRFVDIFQWKVDFKRQVRAGDEFKILYEEQFSDHQSLNKGEILAAEFKTHHHVYQAIRYTDRFGHSGYYTPDGKNLQNAFIRVPVKYVRISSPFNTRRKHPILHIIQPHEGVDFAAPTGTPIKASGDGKIVFRGRKGGYGKIVMIKHNGRYTTRYGHMSRFASGLHVNSYVKQGQIIGYVGQTGFSTGPHLHYEFRVNGIPRDPMKIALPKASAIPKKEYAAFSKHAQKLIAQLNAIA